MDIDLLINGKVLKDSVRVSDTLLSILRKNGFLGAKYGGCRKGECGACTVLIDGKPVNSCQILAVQAMGHSVTTIESLGAIPNQGWKKNQGLSRLQNAFINTGAIQCGYCTPAMILAAQSLMSKTPFPSEWQIRNALSGVLCRCTGYKKPVEAVQLAASEMNNLPIEDFFIGNIGEFPEPDMPLGGEDTLRQESTRLQTVPKILRVQQDTQFKQVGKPEIKVDAVKLAMGNPAFTDDFQVKGMLFAKVLHSPHPHAILEEIDISKAKALPGVAAVLTWKDLPRVVYSTAGQSDPIPGPLDTFSLDRKVRFVGDRIAFVAAETEDIAERALKLIEVKYSLLQPILNSQDSMIDGMPIIHDEPEYVHFADSNPLKNVAAQIHIDIGDVDRGFKEADLVFERDYEVPKVQQAHIEPHITITYWDEDNRLVIRTSTQVPFHARRMLAPVLGLPIKQIRVIKPRIGGGFGGKQEVLIEDVAAHLTIATGRPVRYECTREEEFIAARSRHPMKIHMKTGVKRDGTITANEMYCLSDTGAYGCHALTVTGNTGHKAMALYVGDGKYRESPNIRFRAEIVYTNTPPAGAFRGYGVPQGYWAVERQMEHISQELKLDPIEFRLKNCLRAGELHPFSTAWSEGREPRPEIVHTVGLEDCVMQGKAAFGWDEKKQNPAWRRLHEKPHIRRGIGLAFVMQGTAIPYLDMGGASIKMNDDGSFNLLVGATDLGTGSDTVLAQMAAEVLGTTTDDIVVYSSDTDFTPFDKGAYASSTTYISGAAVVKAAQQISERIKIRACAMLSSQFPGETFIPEDIYLENKRANSLNGKYITLQEIAHNALHHTDQEQIMAVASHVSTSSPPPFAAQFAQVQVDIETGQVTVEKLLMAVDSGVIVNPLTAAGQIEGGMTQALGYAVSEEMKYDADGSAREKDLQDYHIFRADEMPELETIFVETQEPTHPFGVKAVAEIPMDGVAPAIGNAILDACGAELTIIPATPERVWRALQGT